jgi:hypothetical protein
MFFIYLKGNHPLKAIKLCAINVAPATNSLYRCDKFNDLIYTGKVISPVTAATYQFLACRYMLLKIFNVRYRFVVER